MKSKENIVFLGMMGSGKSSIGSMVSKKLDLKFFDIDKLIEEKLGMQISHVFELKGEKYFRQIEEEITLKTLKKNKVIISLGGGSFLNKNIRNDILNNHLSFWLNWSTNVILGRIMNNFKRPIAVKSTKEELIDLIKKRSNIYSKALYKVNCNNLTKTEIVNKVLKIYYESEKINC
jgi:shikimate kinase